MSDCPNDIRVKRYSSDLKKDTNKDVKVNVVHWRDSPGNKVFNNAVILDNIFKFLDPTQPVRRFRQVNKATDNIVTSILRKRKNLRISFGDGCGPQRLKVNKKIIKKFPISSAVVNMTKAKNDVEWLTNNHAENLKSLVLNANVENIKTMHGVQDLMKNLKSLKELTICLNIQKNLFHNLSFKLKSVRKLSWDFKEFKVLKGERTHLFGGMKFVEAFPNVQELDIGHPNPKSEFFQLLCHSSWPKLKALSLTLADNQDIEWDPLNSYSLHMLTHLNEALEKLKLTGAVYVESLHEALEQHAQTLKYLTISIDTGKESSILLPQLPQLKELELNANAKHKLYYFKVDLPTIEMSTEEDDTCWWPNGFPQLEKLKIDFPIFENFNNFFEPFLPSDVEENKTLKNFDLRMPTTDGGNAWIEELQTNCTQYFPNALLKVTKY